MADNNTPTWLQESNTAAPSDVPVAAPAAAPSSPLPLSAPTNDNTSSQDDADLPSIILTMRLANMGVSVAMVVVSVLQIVGFRKFSTYVLAIYAILGSLLICCLETQLKFVRVLIALNFGFLFHSVFRFLFYLMMGSVGWSYGSLFGRIVGSAYFAVALFNTYVLCRYPAYRKVREKIAEEEDKRIESRISKEVRKQAANQVLGSVNGGGRS